MSEAAAIEAHQSLAEEFAATGMNENAARILAAALVLFAEKGYSATTVREIVRAAEVTNPMLYYYFESKEGVFKALLDFLFQSISDEIQQALKEDEPLIESLRQVAKIHFDACRHTPEALRFVYSVIFGPRRSRPEFDVLCAYESIQSTVEQRIASALDEGQFVASQGFDAAFLTERFLGLISNHLMSAFEIYDQLEGSDLLAVELDRYLDEQALDRMMSFFLNGAQSPAGGAQ